jgi:metal-responsive CopG/Arc/MetJ family transcriptional regulator
MFGLFTKSFLESEIKDLERELSYKKEEVDRLREILENEKKQTRNELVSFDFKAVKAFSVEREWDSRGTHTTIGYIINNEVKQWALYCSEEQHVRLVKEFEQSRK